jgi:hypothetical protein
MHFGNGSDIEKLMEKLENVDQKLITTDYSKPEIRSMLSGSLDFVKTRVYKNQNLHL